MKYVGENALKKTLELVKTALSSKIDSSSKGSTNGIAELDENGKVPSAQLPSYVDDVVEYSALADFPATGESGKIYIDKATNLTYRWSGSGYVEISSSLALGETISTAYRGDRGKTAYDHSQLTGQNPHGVTASMIGAYEMPSGGIPSSALASAVQTSLGLADSALQSFTETDPVFSASAAAGITASNISDWNGKQNKPVVFTNVSVTTSAWASNNTYTNFPYRATVALTGVTATMIPNVIFDPDTATGGNVAPVAQSYTGGIYIYAKTAPTNAITIPTIVMEVV